jgi:hypothetical protein
MTKPEVKQQINSSEHSHDDARSDQTCLQLDKEMSTWCPRCRRYVLGMLLWHADEIEREELLRIASSFKKEPTSEERRVIALRKYLKELSKDQLARMETFIEALHGSSGGQDEASI